MGCSVDEFYDYLKTTLDVGHRLPNWYVDAFSVISCLWAGLTSLAEKPWRTVTGGNLQSILVRRCQFICSSDSDVTLYILQVL